MLAATPSPDDDDDDAPAAAAAPAAEPEAASKFPAAAPAADPLGSDNDGMSGLAEAPSSRGALLSDDDMVNNSLSLLNLLAVRLVPGSGCPRPDAEVLPPLPPVANVAE